jgi:hypothetical protein
MHQVAVVVAAVELEVLCNDHGSALDCELPCPGYLADCAACCAGFLAWFFGAAADSFDPACYQLSDL